METTADFELGDVIAPRPAVSIEITSTPVLSYALAHNRVPVVSRLAITNFGGPVRAATVRLGVRDAEGPIAKPVELLADLDEGRTTVLTDLGLVMDPAAMLHVEEQRPGVIDVEVEVATASLLGEGSRVVQVLAAQQWLATPVPLALEMLAAHVMPNHPAVTALVSEAAGVLEQKTGSGALVGYAATPERVDEVVARDRRGHAAPRHPLQRAAAVLVRPRPAGAHAGRRPHLARGHAAGHRRRPGRRAGAGRHPAAAVAGRRARLPRLLARGAQRRERRHHRRRAAGQPGRPRADRPGRDDAAHRQRASPAPTCTGPSTPAG